MSATRPLACAFVVLLSVGGCSPRAASWSFQFETPSLEARAVEVEARILEGGCTGTHVLFVDRFAPSSMGVAPPVLGPGTYGLAGRARDASCTWFASGCTEAQLPITQVITELMPSAQSSDPECGAIEGGVSDGALDARIDASSIDASARADAWSAAGDGGHDAGSDAGTDAGSDAGNDAGPAACATTFGGASGFLLCSQTSTSCQFYLLSGSVSCMSICANYGRTCISQYDDDSSASSHCAILDTIACTATRGDTICECSR